MVNALRTASAYGVTRITLTGRRVARAYRAHQAQSGALAMPDIKRSEFDTARTVGPGPGEAPVDDPPPAEHPEEAPGETGEPELQAQARESEQAFERAIARLAPG
jgi:hypothetical protein